MILRQDLQVSGGPFTALRGPVRHNHNVNDESNEPFYSYTVVVVDVVQLVQS